MLPGVKFAEYVRRLARNVFGQGSLVYNLVAKSITASELVRSEGLRHAITVYRLGRTVDGLKPLKLSRLAHPIYVRTGTCDVGEVINVVVRQEYWIPLPSGLKPRSLLDAGAFIGDTAAYFLSRYPDIYVLALEPNRDNYALARRNLAAYGSRIRVVNAALWCETRTVMFQGGSLAGAISADGQPVDAISVLDALEMMPNGRADILKMDIEGAEREVLRSPESWLGRVDHILVELHGSDNAHQVLSALLRAGFLCSEYRSIWHCSRAPPHESCWVR